MHEPFVACLAWHILNRSINLLLRAEHEVRSSLSKVLQSPFAFSLSVLQSLVIRHPVYALFP